MNPITSRKGRALAVRQTQFIESQLSQLDIEREAATAAFAKSEDFLKRQLADVERAIDAYDNPPQQPLLEKVG